MKANFIIRNEFATNRRNIATIELVVILWLSKMFIKIYMILLFTDLLYF